MLDFEIMDKALKGAWTERLKTPSSASWKVIPESGVRQYGGLTFLTKCQYNIMMLSLDNDLPKNPRCFLAGHGICYVSSIVNI